MRLAASDKEGCGGCCLCDWECIAQDAEALDRLIVAHLRVVHGKQIISREDAQLPARGEKFGKVIYRGTSGRVSWQPMRGW